MNVQAKPQRIFNFSAGPATLPLEVLEASAQALVNYQGKGVGIAEVSHRGKEFDAVIDEAITRCKSLLGVAESHDVLFLQGGATQLFTTIPMNFANGTIDYVVGGEWSQKAAKAAQATGAKVAIVANTEATNFDHSTPEGAWTLSADSSYLHVCSNETVHGHRLAAWPTHPNLVVDASSEFMSRPHPVKDCALVYAGAQKNLGPAGVVVAIVRKDWYARIPKSVPGLWNFQKQAEAKSMVNTPPTFGIYILLETFRWLEKQGGLAALEKRNEEKAKLIYDAIDGSDGFYTGTVSLREQRSRMNITFRLPREELTDLFVKEAEKLSMAALKGYRTVGGIRASIYNAMPIEGCQALASHMQAFAAKNR
jgi:phosphoserine aminotransferase